MLGFWGDYNEDTLIPNLLGKTGLLGTESAEGQAMVEDTNAEGWVLTDPNDPDPAKTTALPVAPPAATQPPSHSNNKQPWEIKGE